MKKPDIWNVFVTGDDDDLSVWNTCVGIVYRDRWDEKKNGYYVREMARVDGWSVDRDEVKREAQEIADSKPEFPLGLVKSRVYQRGYEYFMAAPHAK
jgi:hypothetical protein